MAITPLKINIFERFKKQNNCAFSVVLVVFEPFTNIDLQGSYSNFFGDR